jgi:hypothetical protein
MVARRPRTVTQAANRRDLSLKKAPPSSIGGTKPGGARCSQDGPGEQRTAGPSPHANGERLNRG